MTSTRLALGLTLATVFVLAACGSGASTAASSPTSAAGSAAADSARPTLTGSAGPAAGQTDTDWGRIWDTLPSDFPKYPGATPGQETAAGPASANLVVDGLVANGIATFMQAHLQSAGYKTEGLSGPLEDGTYVLDMVGPVADCSVEITAAPTGSLTTVTILYGADCPHG